MEESLFLAILAMDSYNRGYSPGIKLDSSVLGSATIIDVALPDGAEASGFYASAYLLPELRWPELR